MDVIEAVVKIATVLCGAAVPFAIGFANHVHKRLDTLAASQLDLLEKISETFSEQAKDIAAQGERIAHAIGMREALVSDYRIRMDALAQMAERLSNEQHETNSRLARLEDRLSRIEQQRHGGRREPG